MIHLAKHEENEEVRKEDKAVVGREGSECEALTTENE